MKISFLSLTCAALLLAPSTIAQAEAPSYSPPTPMQEVGIALHDWHDAQRDRAVPFNQMSHSETCLVIFNGGDHFFFSGRERIAATLEKLAQDAVFQNLICTSTNDFWNAYLKGSVAAKQWLLGGAHTKHLGDKATFEQKVPKERAATTGDPD